MLKILTLLLVFCFCPTLLAQKRLELTRTNIGGLKITKIGVGEVLEYKLLGERKYRRDKILDLHDSTIVFESTDEIWTSEIAAIKLGKSNHLIIVFQRAFVEAGIIFILLNTINTLIVDGHVSISPEVLIISASLVATGFAIRQIGIRRIKITKNKSLRIVNVDFQNLNSK